MEREPDHIMSGIKKNIKDSIPFTIGIEEEYMICDSEGNLINKADSIMTALEDHMRDRFSYELIQSEIESNTSICQTVDESIDELLDLRSYLKKIGDKHDYNIGISGPTGKIEKNTGRKKQ